MSVGRGAVVWPCPVRAAVPCGPFYQKAAADAEARQAEHDYLSHVARSVNAVAIVHDGLTISTIGYRWTPTAGRSSCRRTRPASRTATGSGLCCGPRARAGRSWRSDTRTAATQAPGSPRPARSASRGGPKGRQPGRVRGRRPADGWSSGFFAWINRNRRLAKDFEATIESVEAFLYAAFQRHPATKAGPLTGRFGMDSKRSLMCVPPRNPTPFNAAVQPSGGEFAISECQVTMRAQYFAIF